MIINHFDCYCNGENVKNIKKITLSYRGKLIEYDILGWFSNSNYHFFYIMRPDGLKQYYYDECKKEIKAENKTYDKLKKILGKISHLWIRCGNTKEIKKLEGIFFDLWGENVEIMDNSQFCKFAKDYMYKEKEIGKYILLTNLLDGEFKKGLDNWLYLSMLNTFIKEAQNVIILSLKPKITEELDIKEVKYNDIC